MSSDYPSYGDLYSDPKTNPNNVTPGSSTPGLSYEPVAQALAQSGYRVNPTTLQGAFRSYVNYQPSSSAGSSPTSPLYTSSGGSSGFSYGGGGGGGGGGGPSGITQAQLDWISKLLGQGEPDPLEASILKLPKFRSRFHPQMYNQMLRQYNRAVGQDTRVANRAYNRLGRTTRNDYVNAFTNPRAQMATMRNAPGMDVADMGRLMQGQGLDPALANQQMQGAAAADRGFQNLWGVLGANEDLAQRGRLRAIAQDRIDTANAIKAAAIAGRTGIKMQRAGAKDEWRTKKEDTNYQRRIQQAMSNWTQANQVAATNTQNQVAYRNNLIQALIGLVPSLAEGVTLPEVSDALGLTPPPTTPAKKTPAKKLGEGPGKGKKVRTSKRGPGTGRLAGKGK